MHIEMYMMRYYVFHEYVIVPNTSVCVCVCACACVHVYVCACSIIVSIDQKTSKMKRSPIVRLSHNITYSTCEDLSHEYPTI